MSRTKFPWSNGNVVLLATLEEIGLPERLVTSMRRDNIRLVGELVQLTQSEILRKRGLGSKSLQRAKEILDRLGLVPGTVLKGWSSHRAYLAREEMGREIHKLLFSLLRTDWKKHDSLESELSSLLREASRGRNDEMLSLLFGFNENGPQTLEFTGQKYGLTRERVRQIAAKAQNWLASVWRPATHLFAVRDLLNSGLQRPFTAAEFSEAAKRSGITSTDFHVDGAIRALDLVGEPNTVDRFRVNDITFYGSEPDQEFLEKLLHQIRKDTSARGCIGIDRLIGQTGRTAEDADEIHRLLSNFEEIAWLDDAKSWLMSTTVSRNRLVNVTGGIFSVIPSLDMGVLCAALQRPRRIVLVPPEDVLAAFLEINGIANVTDGQADALPSVSERALGLNDAAFVKAFRDLGSPVIREKLENYCVDQLGVNVRSFYVNLSYSPLVVKVAPGVFSLLGEKIDPDKLDWLKSQVKRSWYRKSS